MRQETVGAATTVQSNFRGYKARKAHAARVEAANREVAAFVKGCIARVIEAADETPAVGKEDTEDDDFARRSSEFDFASRSSEFEAWAGARETA
jgi:hypothetical protein